MNIILGIVGAALADKLLALFGVALGGWLGYLIAGFVGACIIIFLWWYGGRGDKSSLRKRS
jgi:uncharacterized membrane protein YeaQ/YmgE (transglycosylase-associated protein family)